MLVLLMHYRMHDSAAFYRILAIAAGFLLNDQVFIAVNIHFCLPRVISSCFITGFVACHLLPVASHL